MGYDGLIEYTTEKKNIIRQKNVLKTKMDRRRLKVRNNGF